MLDNNIINNTPIIIIIITRWFAQGGKKMGYWHQGSVCLLIFNIACWNTKIITSAFTKIKATVHTVVTRSTSLEKNQLDKWKKCSCDHDVNMKMKQTFVHLQIIYSSISTIQVFPQHIFSRDGQWQKVIER